MVDELKLDFNQLRDELTPIHRALSNLIESGHRLTDELRHATGAAAPAIVWQSLFADCLRVIHAAVAADENVSDAEVTAVYEPLFSIARHYSGVQETPYGEFGAIETTEVRKFLDAYARDAGPFGRGAAEHWPGLALCRKAAELGEPAPLESYERMMAWLIACSCEIGGVNETDPRWRGRVDELHELRRVLARGATHASSEDLRLKAFLEGTGVFAAVQPAWSVYDEDPFDVDEIHADVREVFDDMVYRAVNPNPNADNSRMLLVLGDSGAGKTHLLRGLRHRVHEQHQGFVVYAQMHSSSDNYARYLLQHVVDSLARPYFGPTGGRTSLFELAHGLPTFAGGAVKDKIDRLIDDDLDADKSVHKYINELVDDLVMHPELGQLNGDLLRVLLYALHPDQRTTARVYKYLRCEPMTDHDRSWLGGVAPRLDAEDPMNMIMALARVMHTTQQAALVLMLDQAELAGHSDAAEKVLQRAIDTLHSIVTKVPSTIAVLSCLTDLYNFVRPALTKSALDRLEHNPHRQQLDANRSYGEILALVSRRLEWLYEKAGAVFQSEAPVYPIPEEELRGLTNWRTRDVLDWCHQYQQHSIKERGLPASGGSYRVLEAPPIDDDLRKLTAEWNEALHATSLELPEEEEEILALLGQAAALCAQETGFTFERNKPGEERLRVQLTGPQGKAFVSVAVTNKGFQRGAFAEQIDKLRQYARGATPVAVRTVEFPRGAVSGEVLGKLIKSGGRTAHLDISTLRTLAAFEQFRAATASPRFAEWQRQTRPISNLTVINQIFELERLGAAPGAVAGDLAPPIEPPDAAGAEKPAAVDATRAGKDSEPNGAVTSDGAPAAEHAGTKSGKTKGPKGRASRPGIAAPAATAAPPAATAAPPAATAAATAIAAAPSATPLSEATTAPMIAKAKRGGGRGKAQPADDNAEDRREPATVPPADAPLASDLTGASNGVASPTAPPTAVLPSTLHVGVSTGFSAEPRDIELASLLRHVGVLGSSGSGKTTLALALIEQVLERDIPVIMVDRKGDLAGYARPDWWQRTANPERARGLAQRLDVRLFTPGAYGGRPLALTAVPDLTDVPTHERERMINYATAALAAMMRLGKGANDSARKVILSQAIAIVAERGTGGGLPALLSLVEQRDDALIGRCGSFDDGLFKRLTQDLRTLHLSETGLFDPKAEPLTAETLIGRRVEGKVPLAIISTRFLGEVERAQSWMAHLLACLSRHIARAPSTQLSTLLMVDEADIYMPAVSKPPSKEPMQDLLKRARAAGLGMMLATQSPADFDYRSREQINSWFVGKIAANSIEKMKLLFEQKPQVANRLGSLEMGRFVMMQEGAVADLARTPSLLRTDQLDEQELTALAAQSRLSEPAAH